MNAENVGTGEIPAPNWEEKDFEYPSKDELLEFLEKLNTGSEEEKEKIREHLRSLSGEFPAGDAFKNGYSFQYLILFVLLAFVALIFVFFGYKLYKSLVERERRKEEKRKQKQLRKKK